MYEFDRFLCYGKNEQNSMGTAARRFMKDAREESLELFLNLLDEFSVENTPDVIIWFFAGRLTENSKELSLKTAGWASTDIHDGKVTTAWLAFSLPVICGANEFFFENVLPHEVAHIFANTLYAKSCEHEIEWKQIMQYLKLPAKEIYDDNDVDMQNVAHYADMPAVQNYLKYRY